MTVRSNVIALSAAGMAAMSLAAVAVVAAPNTAGSAAAQPTAAAAPAADPSPSPTPVYRFVGDFSIALQACMKAGQAGIDSGEWDAFVCRPTRGGLDTFWSLWVTP